MDINVTKNKVTITAIDQVHSGEFKVNTCDFNFSDSYEDLVKRAIFTDLKTNNSYEVDIANSTCDIPIEVLKKESICEIGVYAYEESNDELVLRYSPSPARFKITRGSYKNADEGTIFLPSDEFVTSDELENYYTKNEVDDLLDNIDLSNYYTKTEIDNMVGDIGTALDTINGEVV